MHYHLSLWPVDNAYGFASDSMRLSARPPVMNAWINHPEWIFPEGAEQSCRTDAIVVSNTMERYLDRVLCKFEMTRGRATSIVTRVIYPMAVISMLSVFTLWISLEERISAILALFATAAAFYYVASEELPTLEAWTSVDIYFTYVFTSSTRYIPL